MDFLELAHKRSSIRGYKPDAVSDDLLSKVLEAGRMAPSATNRQPWHFIVARDRQSKELLHQAYNRDWFQTAPVIIVICVELNNAWHRADGVNYALVDGAIAMDHITLCAADLGLGTCWVGAFDPEILRRNLALPEGIEPVAMTPLGYPDAEPRPKQRKPAEEVIHWDKW